MSPEEYARDQVEIAVATLSRISDSDPLLVLAGMAALHVQIARNHPECNVGAVFDQLVRDHQRRVRAG
jgi:hypothetical protein